MVEKECFCRMVIEKRHLTFDMIKKVIDNELMIHGYRYDVYEDSRYGQIVIRFSIGQQIDIPFLEEIEKDINNKVIELTILLINLDYLGIKY